MLPLTAVSLIKQLSAETNPSIMDIVQIFRGLQVHKNVKNFTRVILTKYFESPLEPGMNPSRFSLYADSNRSQHESSEKITYGARSIDTALHETVVRNRFDINPKRVLNLEDYDDRSIVTFSSEKNKSLKVLNLTQGQATCFGVPTDVIRSSDHTEGQHFSLFVFKSMPDIDGFLYSSRFTEENCLALFYNRAITKLRATTPVPLNRNTVRLALLSKNVQVE